MSRVARKYVFDGGWATDLSTRSLVGADAGGLVRIPYLLDAENVIYELDGGLRKAPGATKIHDTALEGGAAIMGCYDAWFHGSSGAPSQHRVVNVSTSIKADDGNGVFADVITSLAAGAVPTYAMLEDLLVIGLDSADPPQSFDGTTGGALAGSPPNCSIFETHANRLWAAGDDAHPSRLYYSPLLDPENASGEGWGYINVDPSDGDRITGLRSYKGELIVFKGPKKGSIHRIAGTAPTGADAYARKRWIEGIGAAWQNSIFTFGDDLGFMSFDGSVHSLKAVSAYGDFNEVALSRPIQRFLERANFTQLRRVWAASGVKEGFVLFSLPIDGSTTNNAVIGMDYRFAGSGAPMRWFYWPSYVAVAQSIMVGIDPLASNRRIFFFGGPDGFVRRGMQSGRKIDDDVAIPMLARTPYFDEGDPFMMKTAGEGYVQFSPKNDGFINFGVRRDANDVQVFPISQLAGDPLGLVDGTNFTLGTSKLGEATIIERFFEADAVGEYRQVQFEMRNDEVSEDCEIHGFGIRVEGGSVSTENFV